MIVDGKRIKGLELYKVKGYKEYLYVWRNLSWVGKGGLMYECFATLVENQELPACHSSCSHDYLMTKCTPLSYKKAPKHIQDHLRHYLEE